jgi:hypothetical protein
MRFGLQIYGVTGNLGDEIQSIAARRFLPRVDVLIDRDLPADSLAGQSDPTAVIMNGWYSHKPEGWPPPACIVPLFVSLHISREIFTAHNRLGLNPVEAFLGASSEYLKRWGPVGTRDLETLQLLQSRGIDAYFSGCLTLTLEREPGAPREEFIACVDLPRPILDALSTRTERPLRVLTHVGAHGSHEQRMQQAERLLATYQRAHCVLTTRLHCALPCLALETPVLLIDTAPDQYRFRGLNRLLRHCPPEQFAASPEIFNVNNPMPNQLDYMKFRNSLIDRVRSFIANVSETAQPQELSELEILRMRYNTLWTHAVRLNELASSRAAQIKQLRNELARHRQGPEVPQVTPSDQVAGVEEPQHERRSRGAPT